MAEYGGGSSAAGIGFLVGGLYSLDAIGGLNSSPWTAQSFGGDPAKNAAVRSYVKKAVVVSTIAAGIGGLIDRSPWPLIGVTAMNLYLMYIYRDALAKAEASGSQAWSDNG